MARNRKLRRLELQATGATEGTGPAAVKTPRKAAEPPAPVALPVPEAIPEEVTPPADVVQKKKRTRFVFVREKKQDVPETKTPALPPPRPTMSGKLLTKNLKPLPKPEPGRLS